MNFYSRYFIVKEGLFKNTKKILNVFHNSFTIENMDKSEKETVNFEDITLIQFSDKNAKEFKIKYQSKRIEIQIVYSCSYRLNLISDLLTQIDLYSKINIYPIETFKCFIAYQRFSALNNSLSYDLNHLLVQNPKWKVNTSDVSVNIYRSIFEWTHIDLKKEMRLNFYEIEKIQRFNYSSFKAFAIQTSSKINLMVIPQNQSEIEAMIEKIKENSGKFLGYSIKEDEAMNKEINMDKYQNDNVDLGPLSKQINHGPNVVVPLKKRRFCVTVYRTLYSEIKVEIYLIADKNFIYEYYINDDTFYNQIDIRKIQYIVLYETNENFFELIFEDNSRLIYETKNEEKNIVLSYIIEAVTELKPECDFLVLPAKPKTGKKIKGFPNERCEYEYEKNLYSTLIKNIKGESLRQILEEICLNMCFREDTSVNNFQTMLDVEIENNHLAFNSLYEEIQNSLIGISTLLNPIAEDSKIINELYKISLSLLVCRNLANIIYSTEMKEILSICIKKTKFFSIFYNAVSIYKQLTFKNKKMKKEELTRKTELLNIISCLFVKDFLYSKIYYSNSHKIENFEEQNILFLSTMLNLEIHLLNVSSDFLVFSSIINELCHFDFLFLFYKLVRCKSLVLKEKSIQIMLMLFKNLNIEQEYQLKYQILSRTLLFFSVLIIYIKDENDTLKNSLDFLETLLISHVECTNLILNLFPLTLFYHVENKPKPINWLNHQWDIFFPSILQDYREIKLIWNQKCRNELIESLEKYILNYEQFTDSNTVVLAFYENISHVDSMVNSSTTNQTRVYSPEENVSHFSLNYKEIKIAYRTLNKEVYVWNYYLKKMINEKGAPSLCCTIEKPKKFWKKLKKKMQDTNNDQHAILIIKTMILLYKNYYESIGVFKDYDLFLKMYASTHCFDVKCYVIQLLITTIELLEKEVKEQNIKQLIDLNNIDLFFTFISEIFPLNIMKNYQGNLAFEIKDVNLEEINATYIDNKTQMLADLANDSVYFDATFPNYTNYIHLNSSWETASKETKTITLVIRLYKYLLKRNPVIIMGETVESFKIAFPMPKMKSIFCEEKNFKVLLSIFYHTDENILQETLDLLISYLNDPLTYYSIGVYLCLIDFLFFLMMKYKSKAIMEMLDKLYHYHKIFFNFDSMKLDEEEEEFFNAYPKANRFLVRYLPINVIYFLITHEFSEFILLLYSDNIRKCDLIWNRNMFITLVNGLRTSLISNESLDWNNEYKCNYSPLLKNESSAYLYYLDLMPNIKEINTSHINSFVKILQTKASNESYAIFLFRTVKNFFYEISKENTQLIFSKCIFLYQAQITPTPIEDNLLHNPILLLYCLKITIMLNKLLNETPQVAHSILLGIEFILKKDISHQPKYEKALIRMLNFVNKEKYFSLEKETIISICVCISKQMFSKFDNKKLMMSFLNFCYAISIANGDILLSTSLPYQLLYIMTKFLSSSNESTIYSLSFGTLKQLVNDESFKKQLNHLLGKELGRAFTMTEIGSTDFLIYFKKDHRTPMFIWNSKLISELQNFLIMVINDIDNKVFQEDEIYQFKYQSYQSELKICEIYLSIYNENPTFKVSNPNVFINELFEAFIKKDKQLKETQLLLYAISNCLEFSNVDVAILNEKGDFFNEFYTIVQRNNCLSKEACNINFTCINFLRVLSNNNVISHKVFEPASVFCFIYLIDNENEKASIEKILIIMNSLYQKNEVEKINLSIFLFLLKKLIILKSFLTKQTKDDILQMRKNLLTLICLYSNNNQIGGALRSLYECYLPSKIIDNLFHTKDISEMSLSKWLDNELELPDLIWNNEALQQGFKQLEDDCAHILNNYSYIEDFPNKLMVYKLTSTQGKKGFFFEIADEFKIDYIYLRLFNKEPNYNIGRNLCNFLYDVTKELFSTLELYSVLIYQQKKKDVYESSIVQVDNNDKGENSNESIVAKLNTQSTLKYFSQKLITVMTTVMLIIEQINFNDFNLNLGIANTKEMINVISPDEEYQNNLLPLIQRSFEYYKLLSEDICKQFLNLQSLFFGNPNLNFPNYIRLVYLEILFLIGLNKARHHLLIELFHNNIIKYYINSIDSASDYEIVVLLCLINKLFSRDISYISKFLTKFIKDFVIIAKKRPNLSKYVEMLLCKILNNSQYGDSLVNLMEQYKEDFAIFPSGLEAKYLYYENEVFPIWRKTPEFSEQAGSLYKSVSMTNYLEESMINIKGQIDMFAQLFPIVPKSAILYFNVKDVSIDEVEKMRNRLFVESPMLKKEIEMLITIKDSE